MHRVKEESGHVYGRLTVGEFAGLNRHHCALWECLCSCGQRVIVLGSHLRQGVTQSCGCYHDMLCGQRIRAMNDVRWHGADPTIKERTINAHG
jgi:hypothetical protein